MVDRVHFAIRFDPWYAALSTALFLAPSASFVEIEGDEIRAKMGWGFRAAFPRAAVASASTMGNRLVLSRGVHGMGGRWLVNGSSHGIVLIELRPTQRAYVIGFPVGLGQLMVSVEDPEGLLRALGR